MNSAKSSQGQVLVILILAVVLLGAGGFYVYQSYREKSMTPVAAPASTSTQALNTDLQSINEDLTALDQELGSLDASLMDKQGDLSE